MAEFWSLTLAQYDALHRAHVDDRYFEITLNARTLWAAFASSGSKKRGGGKWSLRDFLPARDRAADGKPQGAPKTIEHLMAMAKHLNAMWGGTDLTKKVGEADDA